MGINKAGGYLFLAALLLAFQSCAQVSSVVPLDAKAFSSLIDTSADEWIVDVRTKREFESGHISSAINMDFYAANFQEQLASLPKDKPLLVYCLSGSRSKATVEKLKGMGYTQLYHLEGGIQNWKRSGLHIEGETAKPDSFTEADYAKLIADNRLLMIDYYAPWCLPCRKMKPYIEKLTAEFEGKVKVVQINTDEARQLASALNSPIPVITFIADGKEVKRLNGLQSEETLREELRKLMGE